MSFNLTKIFILSAGIALLIVAASKLVSSLGASVILSMSDPILSISFRQEFLVIGILELIVAIVCILGKNVRLQAGLIAWLATSFVVYRLVLFCIGYQKPCNCFGTMNEALHVSDSLVNTLLQIILAYLLLGSYAVLFGFRKYKDCTSSLLELKQPLL